ncbi:MAG: galactose mutarotase [Erysipelotrichaceae bacterium]|nr:galactose mutarotase [Erysipelotrichaceae bacterium]MDY5251347.1 aldose epimerase family protein [Erysipelotrichaceae bacterium]
MEKDLETINGITYHLYSIKNHDIEISVCDYGATLCTFKYKGQDIVQGFENVKGYMEEVPYMNATIGRCCNRIKDGEFTLNGQTYHVPINNGPNSLHGGITGFDKVKWNIKVDTDKIVCEYLSVDKEEGYPGNVKVQVVYRLLAHGLEYSYEATSDQDTLLNICNHAFFNLNGPQSTTILNDHLTIYAHKIGIVDKDGCTLNDTLDVKDTPFDFTSRKTIGRDIMLDHLQLLNGNGYDHHYIIDGEGFRKFCEYDNDKLILSVYSDLPGMHLYTGNYLDGQAHGKNGGNYPARSAVCFETQYYPNAINCQDHLKPILNKGEKINHITQFIIKEKDHEN